MPSPLLSNSWQENDPGLDWNTRKKKKKCIDAVTILLSHRDSKNILKAARFKVKECIKTFKLFVLIEYV